MASVQAELTHDEVARLGTEVYERDVKPQLTAADQGKFVAIDVLSGEFEVHESDVAVIAALRARRPGGHFHLERAGHPTACVLLTPFVLGQR